MNLISDKKGGSNRDWGYASYDVEDMMIIVIQTYNILVMKKVVQ